METTTTTTTNTCNGQCAKCSFQQRAFCAAYMARNNYAMMESVLVKLDAMKADIEELHKRVNAIQSNEGELIKPFMEDDNSFESTSTMGQAV